jgi:hypothetical protein
VYEGPDLVGGLYGVTFGGFFGGESMFHRRTDASKAAVNHLVDHLKTRGFLLLDAQVPNPHLVSLGAGAEIDVPTLEGKVKMKMPAGTQSGKVFRMKGRGVKDVQGYQQGDQHVRVVVETPTQLTPRQKELLKEFVLSGGEDINPLSKGFFDKVKELFG